KCLESPASAGGSSGFRPESGFTTGLSVHLDKGEERLYYNPLLITHYATMKLDLALPKALSAIRLYVSVFLKNSVVEGE
ncbi:MAG: hypothetical protein NZ482_10350, partial [Gloeomargarita sp. SKYG98]|nr:hypothetical protein [Gloeomargarita sp. SKYG98]